MNFTKLHQFVKEQFSFKGFALASFNHLPGEVLIVLKRTGKTGTCPKCGRQRQHIEHLYKREVRDLDLREKCFIMFPQAKIKCTCGYRGVEALDFVDRYSLCIKRLEEYVFLLCQNMSIKDASKLSQLNWKTVKNIDKKHLQKLVVPLSELNPKRIGVDEIAYEKGHKYLTIVRDLDLKKVIWIGKGRRKETFNEFFLGLGAEKAREIQVAVMDMWDPYIASVNENCPGADIVFDKFHISKIINGALDSVRKKEFNKADAQERKNMKRKRFLILGRQKRLNDEQRETVDDLKRINARLYEAYLLKEQILDIFDETEIMIALSRFIRWFTNVERSGFTVYQKVMKTLKNYMYGIMNYFYYRLTNAASEGFNNKINIIKRKAYGYRDLEYFKLKILQSCGWKSS